MKTRFIFLLSSLILSTTLKAQSYTVVIQASDAIKQFSEIRLAIEDADRLFSRAINLGDKITTDTIYLSLSLNQYFSEKQPKPYPVIEVPKHNYRWESKRNANGKLTHQLYSPSPYGLACGIYGLMQEALGFAFYHPREMYIPDLSTKWPLNENFSMEVTPKFRKKGFHLHTMHPIELAEPLFNPQSPGALDAVKEYIDWLARNEQNVFDFCLLESIDKKTWITHAEAFTAYAKQRGIITSVDVSLHMIQQKSFQLYKNPPQSFLSKKEQIKRNLDWLFLAHWDIINMEFNSAEFLTGNAEKRNELRKFVQTETEKHGAKLMGRQHVVQESKDLVRSKTDGAQHQAVDSSRGIMAHTVMCYSMTEAHAPVYENENQRHVFEFMKRENKIRETWYYPESAYWVTFDNSVPVYPLPYLSARLADIDTAAAYDVEGHLTFSSGWEMGYWLFDWSIARWSKTVTINHQKIKNTPTQYTYGNPFAKGTGPIMDSLLATHEYYLKEKNLMAYMTAQTVTDELPNSLRKEFHPRPPFTYRWLRNKSDKNTRDSIKNNVISLLAEFSSKNDKWVYELSNQQQNPELKNILNITSLRARHRTVILDYLIRLSTYKNDRIGKRPKIKELNQAKFIRKQAEEIMNELSAIYRYDPALTNGKYKNGTGYTSYDFGYLYTANNLHFWKREEEQAKKNRYDFLFMNIWNVFRIIGIEN